MLAVAFNVFDGYELMEGAIRSVRASADRVVLVCQEVSNFGERLPGVRVEVERLSAQGIVDDIIWYTPSKAGGHVNETNKRNIGLRRCAELGATVASVMDVDEYYDPSKYAAALSVFEASGAGAAACKMRTYYRSGSWEVSPPEEYYVPVFYRAGMLADMKARWTVPVDPTRRVVTDKVMLFKREDLEMHHFSYVRADIGMKLRNSSASPNFRAKIDNIAAHYIGWRPGAKGLLAGKEHRLVDLVEVPNIFNVKDYQQ